MADFNGYLGQGDNRPNTNSYNMADFNGYPGQGDNRPNTNVTWRISMATQDRETTVQIPIAKYYMTDFNGYPGRETTVQIPIAI